MLQAGSDLATVGDILGAQGADVTTMRYRAHTTKARKRQAMEALRPSGPSNESPNASI
jgi:hypothetical protein